MFKRALFCLIAALSIAHAEGPLQSEKMFELKGGQIDHISPVLVPETAASSIVNMTLDDRGQLSKRAGYSVIQSTYALGPSTWVVNGMGYHHSASGSDFFAVAVGSDVYRIGNTFSSYSKVTGTTTVTVDQYNLAETTNFQDNLLFCNEDDPPFYIGPTGNAVNISTFTDNIMTQAHTCATYGTYVVIGNTVESGVAYPSRVRWSDINAINSYPALNFIDVEPNDGDKIVAMTQYEDSVYIFKKHSIYRMLITGSSGPDAFLIRPVARNNGAYAKNSVRVVPGVGIVFLGQNTVYTLNGSYASQYSENGLKPIGDPIQRTLDATDRTQWAYASASIFPKHYQYWLTMSTSATQSNNEVLVYDYIQNAWTTYTNINAASIAEAEDNNGNTLLITGDNHATTYEQDQATTDFPKGVQTNIASSYTTGDISFGTPDLTKNYKYMYIFTNAFSTATLTVQAAMGFSPTYDFSQTVNLSNAAALYDVDTYDNALYPGLSLRYVRIELNQTAPAIRFKFTNSDSFSSTGAVIGFSVVYTIQDYRS